MSEQNRSIWSEARIPAEQTLIPVAQAMARALTAQIELTSRQQSAIELAIEEVIATLLNYGVEPGEQSVFALRFEFQPPKFIVQVHSDGLPFDLSLIPSFDIQQHDPQQTQGLSLFLLKHLVDHYYLKHQGRAGYAFVLEWQLAVTHIREHIEQTPEPPQPAKPPPVTAIRPLKPETESISLAQLVYRSYGYSYVYEDIYYPERIHHNHEHGLLRSWVAVTDQGRIAGHIALMRKQPDSPAVEWGIAVTDPAWRGQGLMKKLLARTIEDAEQSPAQVLFAHAVSAHPYTQKTALNFDFRFSALQLCYASSDLNYRGISENRQQRDSTFIATRLLKPLPEQPIYLPEQHRNFLQTIAQRLGLDYHSPVAATPMLQRHTRLESHISRAVNAAEITVQRCGADFLTVIAHEQRRLCQEQVDVLLIQLDLTDPATPQACQYLEQLGFFIAGLTPMLPFAHTLTLQYLNNLPLEAELITTSDATADWIKQYVLADKTRIEKQLLHENTASP